MASEVELAPIALPQNLGLLTDPWLPETVTDMSPIPLYPQNPNFNILPLNLDFLQVKVQTYLTVISCICALYVMDVHNEVSH